MRRGRVLVHGIACEIESLKVRRAIAKVLVRVREFPQDWARLNRRLRRFVDYDWSDGTSGEWVVAVPGDAHGWEWQRRLNVPLDPKAHYPGEVRLSRELDGYQRDEIVAVVAHECGHVVTRERELAERKAPDDEWASELCADRHAFRWGFEREIRKSAKTRPIGHHAVLPGEWIEQCLDDQWIRWMVDRNFCFRRMQRHEQP